MLKVLLLGCLALYVASPSVGNDDDATGPNICNHCAPSVPSISENKLVKLVVTDFRSKPGDCIREHQEALCDSQYKGCAFWGKILLKEVGATTVTPSPTYSAGPPIVPGWEQTGTNPGARKWECSFGTEASPTLVNCNADGSLVLKVVHVDQNGDPLTDTIKLSCGKCE